MNKYLISFMKYFSVAFISFIAPIYYALLFVIILVIADTITGIMKAGISDVKKISSKKLFSFVPKMIIYLLFVIVAHLGNLSIDKSIPFVKLALLGISWIEVKSIDENFREIFGFSFIDKVLDSIKIISNFRK